MTTTAQPTCRVADAIVHWDEVQEGDLVLHWNQFRIVDAINTSRPLAFAFTLDDGETIWHDPLDLVAVRRYVEGED